MKVIKEVVAVWDTQREGERESWASWELDRSRVCVNKSAGVESLNICTTHTHTQSSSQAHAALPAELISY